MSAAEPRRDPQGNGCGRASGDARRWSLRLYVSGMTANSARAVRTVKRLCEEHLRAGYELEVRDLYRSGLDCRETGELLATPQLLRLEPPPRVRVVGDLEAPGVLAKLGIIPEASA